MTPFVKQALHWLGSALAVAGVVFVVLRLNDYSSELDFSRLNSRTWLIVGVLAFVYGLANILLALAWRNLLMHFGADVKQLWAVKIYGLSQLAKYVPGNIMHLASRQAMGQAAGVAGWSLVKSTFWELGLMATAGAFFFILVIPRFLHGITLQMAVAIFFCTILFAGLGLARFLDLKVLRAFAYYIIFLFISGLIFTGVLFLIAESSPLTPSVALMFCSTFVVAWLIGLITPGAPAGIGVRELILVMLLKGLAPESELLLAVLLSRIVTVSGDVCFFLLASFCLGKERV